MFDYSPTCCTRLQPVHGEAEWACLETGGGYDEFPDPPGTGRSLSSETAGRILRVGQTGKTKLLTMTPSSGRSAERGRASLQPLPHVWQLPG